MREYGSPGAKTASSETDRLGMHGSRARWVVGTILMALLSCVAGSALAIAVVEALGDGPVPQPADLLIYAIGLTLVCSIPLVTTTILYIHLVSRLSQHGIRRWVTVALTPVATSGTLVLLSNAIITGVTVVIATTLLFALVIRVLQR